jgi:hypothetical protein
MSAAEVVMLLGLVALAAWLLSLREEDTPPRHSRPGIEILEDRECPTVPTYAGGPVLSHVQADVVLLGAGLAGEQAATDAVVSALVGGPYAATWAPYGPGAGSLHSSSLLGINLGGSVSDREIQLALKLAIFFGRVPPPGPNSLYVVFLPPGVGIQVPGALAYHGSFPYLGGQVAYAVVPAAQPAWVEYTYALSHEIAEAVTDPVPLTGWNAGTGTTEIADLSGAIYPLGGHEVAGTVGRDGKTIRVGPASANTNSGAGLPALRPPSYAFAALVLAADWQAARGDPTTFIEYAFGEAWLSST